MIAEGPRYSVRNVSFLGNRKIDNSRLAAKLKLLGGQLFDQNQQNIDLQKLRDEYGSDGYVFAKIEADNRLQEEPGIWTSSTTSRKAPAIGSAGSISRSRARTRTRKSRRCSTACRSSRAISSIPASSPPASGG